MFRKVIVLLVISLFIGQIFISSIYSKVINNKDEDLVKIDVEIYGLKKDKYSVYLTEEIANNVDKLFIDMRSKLENGSNTKVVFNDAVEGLDEYGLLRGISVEEAQKLVNKHCKVTSFNNENRGECNFPNVVYGTAFIMNGEPADGAHVEVTTQYGTVDGTVYPDGAWQVSGGIFLDGIPMNITVTFDKWQGKKNDIYRGSPTNVGEVILEPTTIIADIRFDYDCYLSDEMIHFYGDIYGGEPPFTWFWNFNDGTISTEQNPMHQFSSVGVYNVSLSANDVNGDNDTDIVSFEIYSTIQVFPSFKEGVYTPGDPVQFYGEVCGGDPVYSWFWDFDDGSTSTRRNPVHEFKSRGIFNVSLTVTDGKGRTNTRIVSIEIVPFHDNYYDIVGTALNRFYGGIPTPFFDKIIDFLSNLQDLFKPGGVFAKFIERLIENVKDLRSIFRFFKNILNPTYQSADISIGSIVHYENDGYHSEVYPSYGWVWVNGSDGVRSWEGDLIGRLDAILVWSWIYSTSFDYIGVKGFNGIYIGGEYFGNCNNVAIEEV